MADTATTEVTEGTKSLRSFRSSQEVETFYRFVHDNGLRREALMIMEFISSRMNLAKPKKKKRKARKKKTVH